MKESLASIDRRCIFRETFESEANTRRLGGVPNSGTSFNEKGINFNNSKVTFPFKRVSTVVSIVISCTPNMTGNGYFIDFRENSGSGYIMLNYSPSTFQTSGGTTYVNGIATSNYNNTIKNHIVISGITISAVSSLIIGSSYNSSSYYKGSVDLFEIYQGTLTASEVALLYRNGAYKQNKITRIPLLLDFDSTSGVIIDRTGKNTLIPATYGKIVKDGSIYAYKFSGLFGAGADRIDCSSDFIGLKAVTLCSWIKPIGWGSISNGWGTIIKNGKFAVYITAANNKVYVYSDTVTGATSANNSISLNLPYFICVTRHSSGIVNIYINAVLSGTANQSSGTPVAGTTNCWIGGSSGNFDGNIPQLQIYEGILTQEEITQLYLSQKHKYGL